MNRTVLMSLAMFLAASSACVSKNYVRQQVTPIINKVNDLDDLTAQNTRAIKETDTRLQSAIQQSDSAATAADQKALASGQQAQHAQTAADDASRRVQAVHNAVVSSDDYRVVGETTVQFPTDRYDLSDDARTQLDQLSENPTLKSGLIVIEGFTDSTGNPDENYSLSSRRASAISQYLANRYNLPAYKMYTIGLGADNPIDSNKTSEGRTRNRRATVQVMSNSVGSTTTAAVR